MAVAALTVLTLVPAGAEEGARLPHRGIAGVHACLDQKERIAANESGKVIRLAAAMRAARKRMPGTVVRARLCRGKEGLVYVLTVLARDGKVAQINIDAATGALLAKY
jgi:uncharacterized membrane protein YkoI